LDAYLLARRSAAISLPLVLAGPIIGDMHAFIERLQRPECRDCVRFLGYCSDSDLPALYRGARAFCFVSLYEGFGFPPLEAMACGTPVIASETSSVGEIVGEAAAKVNPRNVEEIAEAIGVLCSDAETWSRFRNAGIERAGQFTWKSAAEQTWRAYVNALDESSEAGLPTCTTQRIAS
jgi:glycosyltransferase involved in cell wall biosynthesis